MKRVTLSKINEISSFMDTMSAIDRAVPLRLCNTGFDLYKSQGYKEYRSMTVGEFLEKVISLDNIPRPVERLANAVMSVMVTMPPQQKVVNATPVAETKVCHKPYMLPQNTNAPFFEQAAEVIGTLIDGMSTVNDKYKKAAQRLSLGFNEGLNDDQIAEIENLHRERIRQIRTEFQQNLMKGIVPKEIAREYVICDSFLSLAEATINSIVNHGMESVREQFGNLSERKVRYILGMLDLKIVEIEGAKFVLSVRDSNELASLAQRVKIQLKKEYDYVPMSTLIPDGRASAEVFIKAYLKSQSQVYEFADDGTRVRMSGSGLQKAVRIARIIFEAEDWIEKTEIALRYQELYHEDIDNLDSSSLSKMGFAPLGNTGKWRFGSAPINIQHLIRGIITPERPLVTFNTIVKAAEKQGLEYPLSTIRTYITDIATPENKQPDLFCLKGYCHLYPAYSWRSYRKEIA